VPRALITGASSGVGAAFAEALARDGYDLVAVARRRSRLEELAERLGEAVRVEVVVADLSDEKGLCSVEARVAGDDDLELLVSCAGFPGYGPFVELDPAVADALLRVHVVAPTRLARAALPGMTERGGGAIVNIASLLAFTASIAPVPLPYRATYAAAKAYLVAFTQALAGELEGSGVRVQVVCPGLVRTGFHGEGYRYPLEPLEPEEVVAASLAGLELGEVVCVPRLEDAALVDEAADRERAVFHAASEGPLARRYAAVAAR
jgi:uncharacterized protein